MSDLMKKEARGKLALGAGGVAAGIALWTVTGWLVASWPVALISGGVILWGSWRLFQKPRSASAGMVGLVAGLLVTASAVPLVGPLAKMLLFLGGIGLVASGAWALYQVFKSRRP